MTILKAALPESRGEARNETSLALSGHSARCSDLRVTCRVILWVFMQNHPPPRGGFLDNRRESIATVINSALACLRERQFALFSPLNEVSMFAIPSGATGHPARNIALR